MSENVQTFSGKVNVADNLLVGTSHFFVDRQNNRVGIGTSTPDASSMLDVTGNIKSGGTITATGGFSGDGSGLSGVNSDSGSWVNGSSSNIHLAVSTDNVGIGVLDPNYKLDVNGDINISLGSTLRVGGTPAVFSNWSVDGSDIYRSSGNVGIGTTSPIASLDIDGGPESDTVPALSIRGGLYDTSDLYVLNTYSVDTGVGYAAKVIGVNIKNKVETDNTVQLRNNVGGLTSAGAIYLGSDNVNQGVFGVLTCEGLAGTPLTEKFTVTDSGNVGIGVTSPDGPLHLNLPANSNYTGFTYQSGDVKTVLGNTGDGGTNTSFVQVYSGVTSSVPDTNSSTYNLTLQPYGGNVGIGGVLQPVETLDILGSMRIGGGDGMLTIESRTNPSFNYGNESVCLQTTIDGRALSDASPGTYGGENRNVLALQPDGGYVGVGTVSPNYKLHVNGNIRADTGKRNIFYHPPGWGYSTVSTSDTNLWSFNYNFPYNGYVVLSMNGHFTNSAHNNWVYAKIGIDSADPADNSAFYDTHTVGGSQSHGGDFHAYKDGSVSWQDINWGGTLKVNAGNRAICLRVRCQGGTVSINGLGINMMYFPTNIF